MSKKCRIDNNMNNNNSDNPLTFRRTDGGKTEQGLKQKQQYNATMHYKIKIMSF